MSNLTNQQKATYALLADNVYWDVRYGFENTESGEDFSNSNWTPVPEGWTVLGQYDRSGSKDSDRNTELDGFSERVFQNTATNEIVIGYAGTQPSDLKDWKNNTLLAPRLSSNQANEAA